MPTEYKKITELTLGSEITGTEQLEMVQAGNSRHLTSDMFPLRTYPYVTVGNVGLLSQSRALTAGTGISLTDAGNTLTVNATGVLVSSAQFVLLATDPDLPNERVLTGTANQIILTDNGAGSTIVLSTPQNIAPTSSPTFANLTLTNPLTVPNGGTGVATLTGLVQGNGAGVFTAVANSSTVGQVLRVTGAATYAWGAVDLADTDAVTGLLAIANGGTGAGTKAAAFDALSPMTTLGDTIYGAASGTGTRLAGNITTTLMFLSQTGNGAVSAAPAWAALPGSFSGFANPTASIGLTAVNGVATTAMRSDAAPLLAQTISPTWSGVHLFSGANTATSVGTTGVSPGARASAPSLFLINSAGAANNRIWEELASTTVVAFRALSDDNATAANYLAATRSNTTITDLSLGNATNNPTFQFLGTGTITSGGVFRAPDGLVGTPTYSFSGDPDTGVYHAGTNTIGLAAGGALIADFEAVGLSMGGTTRIFATDGAVGTPSYTFNSDQDTGVYSVGANSLGFQAGGARRMSVSTTQVFATVPFQPDDGLVGTPIYSFNADPDTGIYRIAADDLGITVGGVLTAQFRNVAGAVKLLGADGSAAAPYYSFDNDPDTGIFRGAADDIGIAVGGGTAIRFNGGTATGTATPTLTANKPGANAGIIAWLPVRTSGGTQGYIPIFGA